MPLTVQQIVDLRADMGDLSEVWSDVELGRLWDRTAGAVDEYTHLKAVKALMFEGLLNNASKLHDYTAGATGEKLSQIVTNLEKRLAAYEPALEAAMGQKIGMTTAALRSIPNQERNEDPPETWNTSWMGRRRRW